MQPNLFLQAPIRVLSEHWLCIIWMPNSIKRTVIFVIYGLSSSSFVKSAPVKFSFRRGFYLRINNFS